jgi:hypothetical protein
MQGESMDAEPARLIIEALKEEKIDLYASGGTHGLAHASGASRRRRSLRV